MNGGLDKAKAAPAGLNGVTGLAPTHGLPSADKPLAAQAGASAQASAKMPKAAKLVEARKAGAPKRAKKRAIVATPATTKTRCFAQRPAARIHILSGAIPESSPTKKVSVFACGAISTTLETGIGLFSRIWRWIRSRQMARSGSQRLHVASTASLGEKRFVAVIQIDGLQFLVGGGATNVVLLAKLDATKSFGDLLHKAQAAHDTQLISEQAEGRA